MAQQIRLNMAPGSLPETFHVSQNDSGRELTAVLEDGGTAFEIPPGATAKLVGTKPSGLGFQISAACAGNIVKIITETTMTNEHGRIPAEIRIIRPGIEYGGIFQKPAPSAAFRFHLISFVSVQWRISAAAIVCSRAGLF